MEKPEKKKPRQRNKRPFPFTVGETFSLARRAIRSLAPKGSVSGSFGTGDPAETGLAYGIMLSILEPLSLPVSVTPDFDRAMFALKGSIAVRVLGARLIAIFLGSYLTRKKRKVPGNV